MPPTGHPTYRAFRDMELDFLGPEYAEQKQSLEAVHGRDGTDLYVASFSAVGKEGGGRVSYCVWGDGVDSLLPVTQKVSFITQGHQGPVAVGSWDRVRDVVGDLMEPTDHYPARFRVRRSPDKAALAAIGTQSLSHNGRQAATGLG